MSLQVALWNDLAVWYLTIGWSLYISHIGTIWSPKKSLGVARVFIIGEGLRIGLVALSRRNVFSVRCTDAVQFIISRV